MKKSVLIFFAVVIISMTLACNFLKSDSPEETSPMQIDTVTVSTKEPLPFTGIWLSEIEDKTMTKQVLVFTDSNIYHVQTGNWANAKSDEGKEGGVHEEFFEIVSTDPENNTMVVRLKWIRTDGRLGGFDMPTRTFKYSIDGDAIRFSFGPEGEYPTSADSDPYYKQ